MYADLSRMKQCSVCKKLKVLPMFYKTSPANVARGKAPYRPECRQCSNGKHQTYWQRTKPERNAKQKEYYKKVKTHYGEYALKRLYGFEVGFYNKMLKAQGGVCKVCKASHEENGRRFDVDHCHKTGRIRGLLCIRCNRGIGLLRDSVEVLKAAIKHIED